MASLSARRSRALYVVLLLATAPACTNGGSESAAGGDGGRGDTHDPSRAADGGRHDGAASGSADASAQGLRAQLRASTDTRVLCAGACTELTASAEQGTAPYAFHFDHELGTGAGPHRVCPRETTTYEVRVSDSSFEGEFGGQNADVTARVTIEVNENCSGDAGSLVDATVDAGGSPNAGEAGTDAWVPDAGPVVTPDAGPTGSGPGKAFCTQQLARIDKVNLEGSGDASFQTFYRPFRNVMSMDPQGRLVFATDYHSFIRLMDGTALSARFDGTLIGVLTPNECKPVWFKHLTGRGSLSGPQLAIDSKGRIVILAYTIEQHIDDSALYLAALSPTGDLLWEKYFDADATGGYALRVDANDDIVVLTSAQPGSNFGGAALGSPLGARQPAITALLKFRTSNGGHVWSKLVSDVGSQLSLAIQNGTDIVLHGWSDISRNWGAGGRTTGSGATGAHGYLVRADAAGNFTWSLVTAESDADQYSFHSLDANRAGQLVLSNVGANGELALTNSNAQAQWHKRVIGSTAPEHAFDWNKSAINAQSDIFLAGNFEGSTSVNGDVLAVRQPTGSDAFVQKLDVNGEVRWTYQVGDLSQGAASSEIALGVTADDQGNAYTLVNTMGEKDHGLWVVGIGR